MVRKLFTTQLIMDEVSISEITIGKFAQVDTIANYFKIDREKLLSSNEDVAPVWKGIRCYDNTICALKQYVKKPEESNDKLKREIKNLESINHENVVKLLNVITTPESIYLVLEYCPYNLSVYLTKFHPEGLKCIKHNVIATQITNGYRALYDKNILHRDLKSQNILVTVDGNVKLTDFGSSRVHTMSNTKSSDVAVTLIYLAPEIGRKVAFGQQLKTSDYNFATDIWSLGLVLLEVYFGKIPIERNQILDIFLHYDVWLPRLRLPFDYNQLSDQLRFKDLAQRMLHLDYQQRITPEDFFNHVYIIGTKPQKTLSRGIRRPDDIPFDGSIDAEKNSPKPTDVHLWEMYVPENKQLTVGRWKSKDK